MVLAPSAAAPEAFSEASLPKGANDGAGRRRKIAGIYPDCFPDYNEGVTFRSAGFVAVLFRFVRDGNAMARGVRVVCACRLEGDTGEGK